MLWYFYNSLLNYLEDELLTKIPEKLLNLTEDELGKETELLKSKCILLDSINSDLNNEVFNKVFSILLVAK